MDSTTEKYRQEMKDLDEAIKHCIEVAENNERKARNFRRPDPMKKGSGRMHYECILRANEQRQLAKLLTELKARREAMETIKALLSAMKIPLEGTGLMTVISTMEEILTEWDNEI